tara:strand:+ start:434 stop:739 length:306 start_codon:yes stop_codon:yes gene_type:complete
MRNKFNLFVFAVVFAFVGAMALSSCNDSGKSTKGTEVEGKCNGRCGEGKCGEETTIEKTESKSEEGTTDSVAMESKCEEGNAIEKVEEVEKVVDEHEGHNH